MDQGHFWFRLQAIALLVALPCGALGQSQPAAEEPRLIFSPWVKFCLEETSGSRACATAKDGRDSANRLRVSVAVMERVGDQRKTLRVTLPHGVTTQHDVQFIVDGGEPVGARVRCAPLPGPAGDCIADYEATPDLLDRMRDGQVLTLQAVQAYGRPLSVQFGLREFAQVFGGPPTTLKAFEEAVRNRHIRNQSKQLRERHDLWRRDRLAPDSKPWKDDTLQPHLQPRSN